MLVQLGAQLKRMALVEPEVAWLGSFQRSRSAAVLQAVAQQGAADALALLAGRHGQEFDARAVCAIDVLVKGREQPVKPVQAVFAAVSADGLSDPGQVVRMGLLATAAVMAQAEQLLVAPGRDSRQTAGAMKALVDAR